jgi:hypothetical protein
LRKNFIGSGLIVVAALAAACSSDPEDDGSGGAPGSGGAGPTSTTTTTATTTSTGGDGGAGSTTTSGTGGAGGSGEGGDATGGSGGGSTGDPGWTRLTLLEGDASFHDQDDITAIYFSDLETGFVGTRSADESALYTATATEITDFAVPEDTLTDPPGGLGDYSVRAIVPTTDGLAVALSTSGAILTSTDDFATFDLEASGLEYGIAPLEALFETDDGYIALIGSGVVAISSEAPAPGTEWTETWAPEASPTTPNPFPEEGCAYGPRTRISENLNQIGGVSPDGQTVIYVGRSQDVGGEHVVCVSSDGGNFFEPRVLEVGEEASAVGPTAALMVSDTVGFVATSDFSSGDGGTATIWKTEDAGDTWTATTIPAAVNEAVVQIATIFFAPGGEVGYAAGQFGAADGPLLLKTTDGGDTWVEPSGVGSLAAAMDEAGTFGRIYTGFALDEDNLWVGGDGAGLFYSNNGAED